MVLIIACTLSPCYVKISVCYYRTRFFSRVLFAKTLKLDDQGQAWRPLLMQQKEQIFMKQSCTSLMATTGASLNREKTCQAGSVSVWLSLGLSCVMLQFSSSMSQPQPWT